MTRNIDFSNVEKRVEGLEKTVNEIRVDLTKLLTEIPYIEKNANEKFDALNQKINNFDEKLDAKINHLDEKLNAKINSFDEKLKFYATKEDLEKQANSTKRTYYRVTAILVMAILVTNPNLINTAQSLLEIVKRLHI